MTRIALVILSFLSVNAFSEDRCYKHEFSRGRTFDLKVLVKDKETSNFAPAKVQLGKLIPGQDHTDRHPKTRNSYDNGTCDMTTGECTFNCEANKVEIVDSLKMNFSYLSNLQSKGKRITCQRSGHRKNLVLKRVSLRDCNRM